MPQCTLKQLQPGTKKTHLPDYNKDKAKSCRKPRLPKQFSLDSLGDGQARYAAELSWTLLVGLSRSSSQSCSLPNCSLPEEDQSDLGT